MTIGSRVAIVLVLAMTSRADAQTAEAEILFREGKRLFKAGKVAAACEKFEASERIEPENGTELNLADCWARIGRTASAWAMFVKAAASAKREDRAAEARKRAAELKEQLVHLTIEVPPETELDELEITRNDQVVDRALWNEEVPVDPGEHTITARAPKREEWSTTVKVRTKDKVIAVPKLERAATRKRTAKPEPGRPNRYRGLAIGLAVGGGGAIVVASGLAFHSKGLQDQADTLCPMAACTDVRGLDLNRRARREALIANVGWGLGGAAVIAAIVTWAAGGTKPVSVTPVITDDRAGVAVGGRF
jgi:hypothetical protein